MALDHLCEPIPLMQMCWGCVVVVEICSAHVQRHACCHTPSIDAGFGGHILPKLWLALDLGSWLWILGLIVLKSVLPLPVHYFVVV